MAEKGEFGDENKSMHFMILSNSLLICFIYSYTNWRFDGFSYQGQVNGYVFNLAKMFMLGHQPCINSALCNF